MNGKIEKSMATMQKELLGYVGSMSYCYSKLCVDADATALLDIEIKDGDMIYSVEDIALLFMNEERKDIMDLFPKDYDDQLNMLSKAVAEYYPEFQQEILTAERDKDAEEARKKDAEAKGFEFDEKEQPKDLHYLRLTMPPVDDDRKKVLEDGITIVHDTTQARMDATYTARLAEVTALSINEPKEEIEAIKKGMEDLKAQYEDIREQFTDKKKKEVEDANARYHEKQAQENGESGASSKAGMSLKME